MLWFEGDVHLRSELPQKRKFLTKSTSNLFFKNRLLSVSLRILLEKRNQSHTETQKQIIPR